MFWWKKLKKNTPQEDQAFEDRMREFKPRFQDRLAMMTAAFFTLILPASLILLVFGLFALWLFGAL